MGVGIEHIAAHNFVLSEITADDLASGVDAKRLRFERSWELEVLESLRCEQECVRETVRAFGVAAPLADDVTEDVGPMCTGARGARTIDRGEDPVLEDEA